VVFRFAADGNGGCCIAHDFSRNPRSSASTFCRDRCRSRQSRLLWQLIDWFRRRLPFSIDAASYHVNPPISAGSGHAMNGCSGSISDKPVVRTSGGHLKNVHDHRAAQ
jgi:hypothetical protein